MNCVATDKRRFARVDGPICTWLAFRKDFRAYGTLTVDLGIEGAQFRTNRSVTVGEQVLVTLQLPSANIECKGRVCWTQPAPDGQQAFGVRFLDLREVERENLNRHIAHHAFV